MTGAVATKGKMVAAVQAPSWGRELVEMFA
jgi:hypothetical protein